jgi:hypothetical protein
LGWRIAGFSDKIEKGQRLVDQIGHQVGDLFVEVEKKPASCWPIQQQIVNKSLTKFVSKLVMD